MKHLGNCKPSEFVKYSFPAKKAIVKWISAVGLTDIRGTRPDNLKEETETMTDEEKANVKAENLAVFRSFLMSSVSNLFDQALGEHPEETIELITALCCTTPEHFDDEPTIENYFTAIMEILENETLINFIVSCYSTAVKAIVGF